MTTITFSLPDKYLHFKNSVNQLINNFDGDYSATQTKDGTVYIVDFENDESGQEFNKKVNELIPDLYKY